MLPRNEKWYCIKHESETVVCINVRTEPFHEAIVWAYPNGNPSIEWEECYGPFFYYPPPELTEEQWEAILASEEVQDGR